MGPLKQSFTLFQVEVNVMLTNTDFRQIYLTFFFIPVHQSYLEGDILRMHVLGIQLAGLFS